MNAEDKRKPSIPEETIDEIRKRAKKELPLLREVAPPKGVTPSSLFKDLQGATGITGARGLEQVIGPKLELNTEEDEENK